MKKFSRREALASIGTLTGAGILSGCAVNPATGRHQLMLMSEQQEISMGKKAHEDIKTEYGVYNDNSLQEWFNAKGHEIAMVTQRKNLPYTFTILDSPIVNAFAIPGGFVYATRGILGYFNDEAQFAGVLGHELGHVNARHTASRYSKAKLATLGIALGSIFSEEFSKYSDLASLGTTLLFLKFSRDDERQADYLGVEYSSLAGYDATHVSGFFKTLERMQPAGGSLPAWQSTHPDPGDRIVATRKEALAFQKDHPTMTFVSNREQYLERVNGLIFGDDPRQGYVKNGIFYHPAMKFQFPVPSEWQVTNQPSQVRLSSKDQNAIIMFSVEGGDTPRNAATSFASKNNATIASSTSVTVNNMEGLRTVGEVASQDQVIGIVSYFIKMDDKVFAFHGLTAPSQINLYDTNFKETAFGFNRLSDQKLIDVSPERIHIERTSRKTTVKDLFTASDVSGENQEKLAVINGVELTDVLEPGTFIKLVE